MKIELPYRPHPNQAVLHNDGHRYIVVCAGRRFGKSVFARMHCLMEALFDPGLYWIVSPTYRQGKMIHWHELKKEIPRNLITYKNEQELSIHLKNGSRIELKGADNEDSLRGVGLKGVVLDEAADQKPHIWEEILRPMLLDSQGWAIFIGTPKGFNWFYDLNLKGQKGTKEYDPEWKSFSFTSYENPYLQKDEIETAKKETDEETFAQEYLAQFKRFKKLIYKEFDRRVHVVEPFEIPNNGLWEVYKAVDFGYGTNPTACLWVAVNQETGKWYVLEEYYESAGTPDYHCGIIMSKDAQYPSSQLGWADPANPQLMEIWSKNGVYLTPAVRTGNTNLREWVNNGISIIREKLKVSPIDLQPQMFVFKNCENLIKEFESYKWKEDPDPMVNPSGRPEDSHNHALDALRYFAISFQRMDSRFDEVQEDKRNWRIGPARK